MSSNAGNANMDQGNQANNAAPPNVIFASLGECPPYDLPEGEVVEEPFESITNFAVMESGSRVGPLTGDQLKDLIQKLDRRHRRTRKITTVARNYTQDIIGVINQLLRLRQRIVQIEINEEYLTDLLKERIRKLITVIEKGKPTSAIVPMQLTNSAKKALDKMGLEGPWNKVQLLNIICTGDYDIATTSENGVKLTEVMEDIVILIKNYDETKHLHFNHVCKKIKKASKDLMRETMTL